MRFRSARRTAASRCSHRMLSSGLRHGVRPPDEGASSSPLPRRAAAARGSATKIRECCAWSSDGQRKRAAGSVNHRWTKPVSIPVPAGAAPSSATARRFRTRARYRYVMTCAGVAVGRSSTPGWTWRRAPDLPVPPEGGAGRSARRRRWSRSSRISRSVGERGEHQLRGLRPAAALARDRTDRRSDHFGGLAQLGLSSFRTSGESTFSWVITVDPVLVSGDAACLGVPRISPIVWSTEA